MTTAVALSPTSSRDPSTCDSLYFPDCRKDTNCNCKMCIASINATLDLVSSRSIKAPTTPVIVRKPPVAASPPLRSTARTRERREVDEKNMGGWCGGVVIWVVAICLIVVVDLGVPVVVRVVSSGVRVEGEVVRRMGEGVVGKGDVKGMLGGLEGMLRRELGFGEGEVGNCSFDGKRWVLYKEDILHMKCVLYKSMAEELSIWGFPLKTSGLLVTGLSSRSFTLLSGHIREWIKEELDFRGRWPGSSWTSNQWGATVIQMGANSWVLEYNQSPLLQESRVVPIVKELLRLRFINIKEEILQRSWMLLSIPDHLRLAGHSVDDSTPPT